MADIVDIAVGAGSFNTLIAAVQAAGWFSGYPKRARPVYGLCAN